MAVGRIKPGLASSRNWNFLSGVHEEAGGDRILVVNENPMPKRETFRKRDRLRRRRDFSRLFAEGTAVSESNLVVHAVVNELPHSRLAVSVNRKVGKAVPRNKIRRRIKEAFRRHRSELPLGFDLLCVVRKADPPAYAYECLKERLIRLATKAAIRHRNFRRGKSQTSDPGKNRPPDRSPPSGDTRPDPCPRSDPKKS